MRSFLDRIISLIDDGHRVVLIDPLGCDDRAISTGSVALAPITAVAAAEAEEKL
jgi:hypothetical protein